MVKGKGRSSGSGGGGEWTQAKFNRFLKEGRGQGEGKDYKPWLKFEDFPPKNNCAMMWSWKTDRVHHFSCNLESQIFYIFEWSDIVTDIREHYPLDLNIAMEIAEEMGMRYPRSPKSRTPHVLTTSYMLTVNKNGVISQMARTVRKSSELENKRVAEKLELERRYYLEKGIDWGIITETKIPIVLVQNLEWLHFAYDLGIMDDDRISQLREVGNVLKSKFLALLKLPEIDTMNITTTDVTKIVDNEMNLDPGTSLYLFRHLVARKEIIIGDIVNTKIYMSPSIRVISNIIF